MRLETIYFHQDFEQGNFYENRVFISLVGPSQTGNSQLIHNWLKIGTFQPKFDEVYFIYQHSQPLYDVMQKKLKNSGLCKE